MAEFNWDFSSSMFSLFRHVAKKRQLMEKTRRIDIILIFMLPPMKDPIHNSKGTTGILFQSPNEGNRKKPT